MKLGWKNWVHRLVNALTFLKPSMSLLKRPEPLEPEPPWAAHRRANDMAKAKKEPRILHWDIETDGINADRILCIGYKFFNKPPMVLRAEDYDRVGLWDDKGLLEAFGSVFAEADYHVTWYGSRFDQPV